MVWCYLRIPKKSFDAVIMVAFWVLWSYRNKLLFGSVKPRKDALFDDVRMLSYFWINNRRRKGKLSWVRWLGFPSMAMSIM